MKYVFYCVIWFSTHEQNKIKHIYGQIKTHHSTSEDSNVLIAHQIADVVLKIHTFSAHAWALMCLNYHFSNDVMCQITQLIVTPTPEQEMTPKINHIRSISPVDWLMLRLSSFHLKVQWFVKPIKVFWPWSFKSI